VTSSAPRPASETFAGEETVTAVSGPVVVPARVPTTWVAFAPVVFSRPGGTERGLSGWSRLLQH
jgi:hypothetical protein